MENLKLSYLDCYKYEPVINKEIIPASNDELVRWGNDNKYPDYIYDLYSNCSILKSIIDGSVDFTFGNGIENANIPINFSLINNDGDSFEDVIKKLIIDYWIFNGFAFQILKNPLKQIVQIAYLDFRYVRTNKLKTSVYYSNSFGTSFDVLKYSGFVPNSDNTTEIFYFNGDSRNIYPQVPFTSSVTSAETQIEIKKFHYNSIVNNFMVNGIVNFNNAGNVDDEVKKQIERDINKKFSGAKNAGKLMIAWNEDKEKGVTFERLTDDTFDEKYQALNTSTQEDIFISMRALPQLFGQTVNTGFSSIEYENAYALYYETCVKPKQNKIISVFNKVFGVENSFQFKPFVVQFKES